MHTKKVKVLFAVWTLVALVGLSYWSEYSIIPKQILPFRWAISLTPIGLLMGAFESSLRAARIVELILNAPAVRAGYPDVRWLWVWGIAVAIGAAVLLVIHFPLRNKKNG